ncbi:MAG: FAD-binding protein, partial [Tabrizicola sp.]
MQPQSEAELAELVAGARGPLIIRGGGTRAVDRCDGEVLETAGLSGVVLYEPGALTLVARVGTPVADLDRLLAAERQRLAFEPPDQRDLLGRAGVSTIGGVAAANACGPRRVQVGAARDALLGVRFVTGRGEVVKNGGRVMKNVTGYDLVKLLAGSHGTLGVLTEVSFKVQAMPEAEATLVVEGMNDTAGLGLLRKALGSPYDISGAARVAGQSLIRVEGMAGSVAYRVQRLTDFLGGDISFREGAASAALWRDLRDVRALVGQSGDLWRLAVVPTAAAEVVAATGGPAVFDWGGGLVWLVLPAGQDSAVRTAVAGKGIAVKWRGEGASAFAPESAEV